MKHYKKALLLAAIGCLALTGCGKSDNTTAKTVSDTSEVTADVVTTETTEAASTETTEAASTLQTGRNPLTGEAMDPTIAGQRPVAVMMGNTIDAMPQYGTEGADIIYEVPVEGGLTRLMPIYQDYTKLPEIMSVRSCRHYFAFFSQEFDSIYVHYGQAVYATEMLNAIDDLNGLDGDLADVTFFRDSSRKAPHNAYINGKSIVAGIEKRGYTTTLSDSYKGHYTFAADGEKVELTDGQDAAVVKPGYLIDKPWFEYNADDGLYYRYQYKAAHKDANSGKQLAYKNVIFQVCNYQMEPDNKYLDVKTSGTNMKGWYITNGKAQEITWSKAAETGVVKYYDKSGNELKINQGKTFVCVVLNDATDKVGIYATKADFTAAQ